MKSYILLLLILLGVCIIFIVQHMELSFSNKVNLEDKFHSEIDQDYLPRAENLILQQGETALSKMISNQHIKLSTKEYLQKIAESQQHSEDEFIQFAIHSNRIVVFSKTRCPFSFRAKQTLTEVFSFEIVSSFEVDQLQKEFPNLQQKLQKITGISTVPQVFIDGCFIGDSEFTVDFVYSGKAKQLVEANNKTIENYRNQVRNYQAVLFVDGDEDISGGGKEMVDSLRTKFEKVSFNVINVLDKTSVTCSIQQQLLLKDNFPQLFINGNLVAVGQKVNELAQGGQLKVITDDLLQNSGYKKNFVVS